MCIALISNYQLEILFVKSLRTMDPLILEVYQNRAMKLLLTTLARCLIVSNFLAEALYISQNWFLLRSILSMRWHCGYWVAGVYISLQVTTQLTGSLLLVVQRERFWATGILWMAAHMRLAANPTLWSLTRYMELCGPISALLLMMLNSRRQAVVSFLLITYLNFKDLECLLWHIIYKYVLKVLLALVMVGFRLKISAGLLVLLMAIHCLDTHIWWDASFEGNSLATRDLRRFHFWNKVSVAGGLILTAVTTRYNYHMF
ncbi:uncharacterized protein LOC123036935 [Drosophila rhopaloa]|uniref:Surfeit locus protein 4 homolog n=2 Tax=Drosophila rhopaloa TaxID=1041015 RepID=A0ABM5J2H4_DRORH|nr:uncharacterized protein LOC123036935 [Drosophila rhopaloa]